MGIVVAVAAPAPALHGLVAGEHMRVLGASAVGCDLVCWASLAWLEGRSVRSAPARHRPRQVLNLVLTQVALLPYLVAGSLLLAGREEVSLFWLVPALLLSLCKATLDAWVLLVEIHR